MERKEAIKLLADLSDALDRTAELYARVEDEIGIGWGGDMKGLAQMQKLLAEAISEFPFATPSASGKWMLNHGNVHWLTGERMPSERADA